MACHWLSLCLLALFLAQGNGQILTLIEFAPCTGYIHENVSRFNSDIYAVEADLSSCFDLNSTSGLSENVTVKIVSPACTMTTPCCAGIVFILIRSSQ